MSGAEQVKTQQKQTNCRLCSYLCGLKANITKGRIAGLEPDPERYPYDTAIVSGCHRFHANLEFLEHPERLNHPLKRVGERGSNRWERISWEQALDEIAAKLLDLRARFGGETLATAIGGPHTTFWPLHRFLNLFGSPNNVGIGQICWNPSIWVNSLTFGWPLENEVDLERTGCLLVWGANPAESDNSLFWKQVRAYRQTGKPLVVIDPRRTRTARLADHWLAPRPGSDAALGLGLLHVIISERLYDKHFVADWCHGFAELSCRVADYTPERVAVLTGIEADRIIEVARLYAGAPAASIFHGRGLDQLGANSMEVHRAIACLKAVTANIDRPGAALVSEGPAYLAEIDLELTEKLPPEQRAKQLGRERLQLQTYESYEALTRLTERHGKRLPARYLTSAQPNLVWRAMLEADPYPIRALIVSGANPLISQADSRLIHAALKSLDLLVALELFPNSTSVLADYVLPMAGSLERPVLQTNAGDADIAYGGPAAIAPLFERRCDFDVWRELGLRCGQEEHWPWERFEDSLNAIVTPLGYSWEEFCISGLHAPPPQYEKHLDEGRGFATASGRIELYSCFLERFGADPLPGHTPTDAADAFPLTLISGGRKQPYWASSFHYLQTLKRPNQRPTAEVSLSTARQCKLHEGQEVEVATPWGTALFSLRIAEMRDGVVNVDYGWWFPREELAEPHLGGAFVANANTLTTADFASADPVLGQWKYNNLPCRICPAEIQEPQCASEEPVAPQAKENH
ncbi:MAG: dehydrogenase [Desulfuromonas sp.]|nr:MAG: dehydrogenase [Desulfuromonas sp.]